MFKALVDGARRVNDVDGVVADAGYDSRDNFKHLAKKGIRPGIKIKRGI